jgi:hypothetical protein
MDECMDREFEKHGLFQEDSTDYVSQSNQIINWENIVNTI